MGSLNEPKVVSIILFLSNNPGSTLLDLKAISFTDTRINRIQEKMTFDGFLCSSDEGEIRSKTTFQLTAKGYRVAAKLKEIDGIMQEIA